MRHSKKALPKAVKVKRLEDRIMRYLETIPKHKPYIPFHPEDCEDAPQALKNLHLDDMFDVKPLGIAY